MPAYFVGELDVFDPQTYGDYSRGAAPIVERFGGRVLAKGGEVHCWEGSPPWGRIVIVEFPTAQAAASFLDCPDYQSIVELRRKSARARIYVVDGAG